MTITRRIITTFSSRLDKLIGELENHDALIKATINEQKKKLSTAKVQLAHIKSNESETRKQIAQLHRNETLWADRAVKEAEVNTEKAMLCMQKRKFVHEQICRLQNVVAEYEQTIQKMTAEIDYCEKSLKCMIQKHELMRARQSSVDAVQVINAAGNNNLEQLQECFDRWQVRLMHGEMDMVISDDQDPLEKAYLDSENIEILKTELQELIKISKGEQS